MNDYNYFFPKENEPPHLCVEMSGNHQGDLEKTWHLWVSKGA